MLISAELPESPPLPSVFSTDTRAAVDGMLSSPTQNPTSQPPLPEADFPTSHHSVLSIHSISSSIAEETDVRNSIREQGWAFQSSGWDEWGKGAADGWEKGAAEGWGEGAADGWGRSAGDRWGKGEADRWGEPWSEWGRGTLEADTASSVSWRRGAVNLAGEPLDEKRPAGLSDSTEAVHLMTYVAAFALDTLPRQLYLHFLLRLPYMYYSRVTRIFEEAEMSMPQIKQGILEAAIQLKEPVKDFADAWELEPVESVQYSKLQNTWQSFIDSLMREWKTLNIISVLLLS